MSRSKVPKLLSLLYVHNPFYLISACLFVYGLKLLFRTGASSVLFERGSVGYMEPWGLMSSFAGVTLLMAITAILIVRFGEVWEDARSLVLIVLLMLLAISVSFDEIVNVLSDRDNSRQHLFLMFAAGVTFAIGVGELLIRGLGLRLSAGYRLPLHGFLLLFFLWPAMLLTEFTGLTQETTRWIIAAFPLIAAGLTLMLIPAIRRGREATASNGTPWSWPLYPWTPFVFIAIAVLFRSYSLTMSFDPVSAKGHYWDTAFGIYQLVPFLLAIFVVLLEIAIVEKKRGLQIGVMLTAPVLLLLSYPWLVPWHNLPTYRFFTQTFVQEIASPVFLTMIALGLMYGYAWFRKVRHAEIGFYLMAVLACAVSPRAFGTPVRSLDSIGFSWWPILIPAFIQVWIGIRKRQALRTFSGLLLGVLALHFSIDVWPLARPWQNFVTFHLVFLSMLTTGWLFKEGTAEVLRELSVPAMTVTTLAGIAQLRGIGFAAPVFIGYAVGMTLLAVALYRIMENRGYLVVAIIHSALGATGGIAWSVYRFSEAQLPSGTKPVVLAAASFSVAVFISILKSGLSRRLKLFWLTKKRSEGL